MEFGIVKFILFITRLVVNKKEINYIVISFFWWVGQVKEM